jgi:hypothetical protein
MMNSTFYFIYFVFFPPLIKWLLHLPKWEKDMHGLPLNLSLWPDISLQILVSHTYLWTERSLCVWQNWVAFSSTRSSSASSHYHVAGMICRLLVWCRPPGRPLGLAWRDVYRVLHSPHSDRCTCNLQRDRFAWNTMWISCWIKGTLSSRRVVVRSYLPFVLLMEKGKAILKNRIFEFEFKNENV